MSNTPVYFLTAMAVIIGSHLIVAATNALFEWDPDIVLRALYAGALGLFATELDYTKRQLARERAKRDA